MVIVASAAFAVGGVFMKLSEGFARLWPSLAVAVLFLGGAVCLARAVQAQGLTTAYVIGLGLEAVVSIALGRFLLGEHLTPRQSLGVALIVIGVAGVRCG